MCGIIGIIHRHPKSLNPLTADNLKTLAHRGPDGSGVYTDQYVQFGHTRLSIIDLSEAAAQPMRSRDKRFVVTFNGEIYNYLELRDELKALGVIFETQSDTEVLLSAYATWGPQCVEKFLGMFAFVIWDTEKKLAFLARDRCGERPLFYSQQDDKLFFASELKGLLPLLDKRPELDPSAIDQYLHYQFVPEPVTLLKGVHKLAAGHTLTYDLQSNNLQPMQYWSVDKIATQSLQQDSKETIVEKIRHSLDSAVKMTLRSDVPVGVALSGGIDSGAIATLAQRSQAEPMHAFCVGYPGRPQYDERRQARELADSLGMIVHEVELPEQSFVDFFPELVRIMDEPIADPAAFGHYSVPKAAADCGVKVLLSGVGGDELFWGYPYVTEAVKLNELIQTHSLLKPAASLLSSASAQKFLIKLLHYPHAHSSIKKIARTLQLLSDRHQPPDQLFYYLLHPDFAGPYEIKSKVYGPAMRSLNRFNPFAATTSTATNMKQIPAAVIKLLFDMWLTSNCLTLGDRVSMGASVETRMPFLDANLIAQVMRLRLNTPDHELGQKAWLREALVDVLPENVRTRPKAGFQPPVKAWLTGVIERYGHMLNEGELVNAGVLAKTTIEYIRNTLPKESWEGLLFAYKLVLLEMWYQKVVRP
jgi:asparagine synthase (glutamine-hydrolysing)